MRRAEDRIDFPGSRIMVAGRLVPGAGKPICSINPATGTVNGEVATAGRADVEAAVAAAKRAAGDERWRTMLPYQRARLITRMAEQIEEKAKWLGELQMRENGKTLAESRSQAKAAAAIFRYYGGLCETAEDAVMPRRGDYLSLTSHEPYGVVAAITPWNSPLTMAAGKLAPALAAGNAVVLKPAEITSVVTLELARLCVEVGLPEGILSVLPGGGEVGAALVAHPDVRLVSFTGGTETGRAIAEAAALRLVPTILELGGKSPHIVLDDADLPRAADAVVDGIFSGAGQSCVAGSRLFIERTIHDDFLAEVVTRAKQLRVGLPWENNVDVGPLASFGHRDRVERRVEEARENGGTIVLGGCRITKGRLADGAFYAPTIVTGIDNSAPLCREEVFGPVLAVLPFSGIDDLVAQANDSVFGLACGIWTSNFGKAWRLARAIEAGTVWVNTYKQLSIAAPFGGYKQSGVGREKGIEGLRSYQQTKSIYLAH